MTIVRSSLLLMLFVALAGCATAVPYEKSLYLGEWAGERAHLVIEQEGYVFYKRCKGTFSRSLEGTLKGLPCVPTGPFHRPSTSTRLSDEPVQQRILDRT